MINKLVHLPFGLAFCADPSWLPFSPSTLGIGPQLQSHEQMRGQHQADVAQESHWCQMGSGKSCGSLSAMMTCMNCHLLMACARCHGASCGCAPQHSEPAPWRLAEDVHELVEAQPHTASNDAQLSTSRIPVSHNWSCTSDSSDEATKKACRSASGCHSFMIDNDTALP